SAISIKKSLFSILCVILHKCFMSYLVVFIDGWKCHQSSLYFISSEMKSWTESRRYCRERGADLIIINNTEEQNISESSSELTLICLCRFWAFGQPDSYQGKEEDCAINYSPGWADYPCDYILKWICEKNIFK
uniref:C-type lectin domain-containing protein n=1 Tax=Cyprinus carpio TaxID=7962 RepID=A0A8C1P330_CYPCA